MSFIWKPSIYKTLQSILQIVYKWRRNWERKEMCFANNPRTVFHKIFLNQWTKICFLQWAFFQNPWFYKTLNQCWKKIIHIRVIGFESLGLYKFRKNIKTFNSLEFVHKIYVKFWYVILDATRNKNPQTISNFMHKR